MSMNELPYYEYKGWFIGQGLTMPAQGIYEVNIYSSKEKLFNETPDHEASSLEEAKGWIDEQEQELEPGGELLGVVSIEQRGRVDLYSVVAYGTMGGVVAFTNFSHEPTVEDLRVWVSGLFVGIDKVYVFAPDDSEKEYAGWELT